MNSPGSPASWSAGKCSTQSGSRRTTRPSRVTGSTFTLLASRLRRYSALVRGNAQPEHPALGIGQAVEPHRPVKLVSVSGCQRPASQPLQVGVSDDSLHQPLAQPLPAEWLQNEHIGYIRKSGVIGYHP